MPVLKFRLHLQTEKKNLFMDNGALYSKHFFCHGQGLEISVSGEERQGYERRPHRARGVSLYRDSCLRGIWFGRGVGKGVGRVWEGRAGLSQRQKTQFLMRTILIYSVSAKCDSFKWGNDIRDNVVQSCATRPP